MEWSRGRPRPYGHPRDGEHGPFRDRRDSSRGRSRHHQEHAAYDRGHRSPLNYDGCFQSSRVRNTGRDRPLELYSPEDQYFPSFHYVDGKPLFMSIEEYLSLDPYPDFYNSSSCFDFPPGPRHPGRSPRDDRDYLYPTTPCHSRLRSRHRYDNEAQREKRHFKAKRSCSVPRRHPQTRRYSSGQSDADEDPSPGPAYTNGKGRERKSQNSSSRGNQQNGHHKRPQHGYTCDQTDSSETKNERSRTTDSSPTEHNDRPTRDAHRRPPPNPPHHRQHHGNSFQRAPRSPPPHTPRPKPNERPYTSRPHTSRPYPNSPTPPINPAPPDHYATLGISARSTPSEIKTAARAKRIATHPDRCLQPGMTEAAKEAVNKRAAEVGMAAEVLGNAISRREYDDEVREWREMNGQAGRW